MDDNNLPQWTILTLIVVIEITKLEIVFMTVFTITIIIIMSFFCYY